MKKTALFFVLLFSGVLAFAQADNTPKAQMMGISTDTSAQGKVNAELKKNSIPEAKLFGAPINPVKNGNGNASETAPTPALMLPKSKSIQPK